MDGGGDCGGGFGGGDCGGGFDSGGASHSGGHDAGYSGGDSHCHPVHYSTGGHHGHHGDSNHHHHYYDGQTMFYGGHYSGYRGNGNRGKPRRPQNVEPDRPFEKYLCLAIGIGVIGLIAIVVLFVTLFNHYK